MIEDVVVDEAGLLDLDAVMRVMTDSFDPAFGEAWTAPQCAGLLPLPGVWLTLARDPNGSPLGFALSRIVAGEAELLLLAVRNAAQRHGVGARLIERFISDSTARGAARLHLEVRDGNHAIALYKRYDFAEVGRRRNYYSGSAGERFDALTLARDTDLRRA
ncbi:GNAT family N-acetyltransferase [Sphingosinicella sp. BN140058]|uniref:GNAT family N-acetyltransferase n=1 Tax=Sphingosinicella sp. BN140058 TaxID=1892855 RepID=UPI001012CB7C|nr:GNAT family N-acetyltransferase [Sphingosinicella sp. BN140058]QAY76095.1 GNAT family N-acetyltransferase [Sphingosinicella sp. BN140058]